MASRKYTDNELLDILSNLAVKLNRTPRMTDMMEAGPPYPSIYQLRFRSEKGKNDGWNNALKKTNLIANRIQIDQESVCDVCGVDGHGQNGQIIRWKCTDTLVCMKCYQKKHHLMKKLAGR